jgi:hypothetical protein
MEDKTKFAILLIMILGIISFFGDRVGITKEAKAGGVGLLTISPTPSPLPNPTEPIKDYREILIKSNQLPLDTFSKLPPMPFDFLPVTNKFKLSQLPADRVTEEYYKQPEFYPNWDFGQERYLAPKEQGYLTYGYGAYPSEYLSSMGSNDEAEVTFFAMQDFESQRYIGVRITPEYPNEVSLRQNIFIDNSKNVTQNVSYVMEHLKIVSITPSEFMLEPAYNQYQIVWNPSGSMKEVIETQPMFSNNWVQKVTVRFKTQNLKAGRYAVVFNFQPPSDSFSLNQSSKYLTFYMEAGTGVTAGWSFGVFFDVK